MHTKETVDFEDLTYWEGEIVRYCNGTYRDKMGGDRVVSSGSDKDLTRTIMAEKVQIEERVFWDVSRCVVYYKLIDISEKRLPSTGSKTKPRNKQAGLLNCLLHVTFFIYYCIIEITLSLYEKM
jgi:hypothetical protein